MALTLRKLADKTGIPLEGLSRTAMQMGLLNADAELNPALEPVILALYGYQAQMGAQSANIAPAKLAGQPSAPPAGNAAQSVQRQQPVSAGGAGQPSAQSLTPDRLMEKLFRERFVFIDLSSFLEPATGLFWEHAVPLLRHYNKKAIVPYAALEQMARLEKSSPDLELRKRCGKRLRGLLELQKANVLDVRKKEGAVTSAQELLVLCAHFRLTAPLLVVTQDEKLAADLLELNRQQSANGKTIQVKRIDEAGYLSNVIPKETKIRIYAEPRSGGDRALPISELPGENDTVYSSGSDNRPLRLLSALGEGGEGILYRTDSQEVAKIYKKDCCTANRREKIQTMIEAGLHYDGICFPKAILSNAHGEFAGYLMDEAKGVTIRRSVFAPREVFLEQFPDWKKRDLVQCAITILKKIRYLHGQNILIGDINPHNFMVISPTEIYLVDTDSFQINDLPCPVGFPDYTAPEIHNRHRAEEFQYFSEIMRTEKNEDFSVATLLFMLLLPGKRPYAQQGSADIVDSILEMHLPYPVGERKGENVPIGPWGFIWSHLPYRIKKDFHDVFNKTPETSDFNVRERLSTAKWLYEMEAYLNILSEWEQELQENPKTLKADPQSLILFPNRLKRIPNVRYIACRGCGQEYPENDKRFKAGFCMNCQQKGTDVVCSLCGKTFTYTNYMKHYLKVDEKAPLYCEDCREKGEERTCLNCGNPFVFTNFDRYYRYRRFGKAPRYNGLLCADCTKRNKEIAYKADCEMCGGKDKVEVNIGYMAYLRSKRYHLPRYCPDCKKKREERKNSPSEESLSTAEFEEDWGREAWDD